MLVCGKGQNLHLNMYFLAHITMHLFFLFSRRGNVMLHVLFDLSFNYFKLHGLGLINSGMMEPFVMLLF